MHTRIRRGAAAALVALIMLLLSSRAGHTQAGRPGKAAKVPKDSSEVQRRAPSDTTSQDTTKKSKTPKPNVSGYVQIFFKARRDANGDGVTEPSVFRMQRVRISFRENLNRHVAYDIEIDPRSPQITGILRDAFISLDYLPHQTIRIGQQKTLFGYENPASSTRLFTVNRSEVSEYLSRGINLRDIGIGVVGSYPLGKLFRLEDQVTVVNGSGMNVQADSTPKKNVWGRIGARYRRGDLTMRLGVSGASGDQQEPLDSVDAGPPPANAITFSFSRVGVDLEIEAPQLFFASEYVTGNDKGPASLPDVGGTSSGYYAIVAVKTPWRVGPLLRYDALEEFRRWTAGAFWGLPADDVSLLLNYEVLKDDLGKHDDKFYLRLQVRF